MGVNDEIDDIAEEEDEDEEPEAKLLSGLESRRYRRTRRRNAIVSRFLGKKEMADAAVIEPRYYGELLAWALHRYIELEGWAILKTVGYQAPQPIYIDVETGCGERQNVLGDGTVFIEKGGDRFAVTVHVDPRGMGIGPVVVTGPARNKDQVAGFADGVRTVVREQNFYRGKKLKFGCSMRFLNLSDKMWGNLVLDEDTKGDIWANTVGFLANRERLMGYGVPIKRGVLLVGEPGTGKTLACKALIAKSTGITCLIPDTYIVEEPYFIRELYEMAQDLSPSIVLIEDVDLIAQEREESGYSRGSALLTLLSVLDGVEERSGVITIATTNCQEMLDKAISKRPSRFDRVIHFPRPALKHRKELISLLCQKIPLDEAVQGYIALKTEDCTPAQIQEVVYTLAIGHCQTNSGDVPTLLTFSTEELDSAISKVSRKNGRHLGFAIPSNHQSECMGVRVPIQNEVTTRVE